MTSTERRRKLLEILKEAIGPTSWTHVRVDDFADRIEALYAEAEGATS